MTVEGHTRSSSIDAGNLVLIVGGYGSVGQRIAKLLADDPGVRLVIGGRHLRRASRFSATLPGGARARVIDIDDPQGYPAALEGVGGDRHGKAALEWLVDRLRHPFIIELGGDGHETWPFEERARAQFPPPFGERVTYCFDFSDQHTLPRTLGVPSVRTWTTYDWERVARGLSGLARLGALRWTRYRAVRRLTVCLLRALRAGSDRFAVAVEAATEGDKTQAISATASGVGEAQATAVIVAATLRRVLAKAPAAGVFQLDELYDLADFEETLAINGIEVFAPAVPQAQHDARPGTSTPGARARIREANR